MSKHKQELVQRVEMSPLNHRDPDFVPNIYFNYISVPSKTKLNVSTTFHANILNLIYTFLISFILVFHVVKQVELT